ncbi:MAG: hypothetical protein GY794_02370 [bacterium]|nr:hypothetical protein [bacterium]
MAIKIRCVDCNKKISIDEAFAGGVCRCPYCTAIVYVPDSSGIPTSNQRPDAPTSRPDAPASRPEVPSPAGTQSESDDALAAAHGQAHIPTAAPVKLQGIVSIVLTVLLLGMVVGTIVLALHMMKEPEIVDATPKNYENTAFTTRKFPAVAGTIKIQTPVVYCIDTSRQMAQVLEHAGNIVIASAKSLNGGKFNLILLGEESDKVLSTELISSDEAGIAELEAFMAFELCGAAEQSRGLKAALDMGAKTVVLLAQEAEMGITGVEGAFKKNSAKLHTILLGGSSTELIELSELTGGISKSYTPDDLKNQAALAKEQAADKNKK